MRGGDQHEQAEAGGACPPSPHCDTHIIVTARPAMTARVLRQGSLINDLKNGYALSNNLVSKLEVAPPPPTEGNDNQQIVLQIDERTLPFPVTFKSGRVSAHDLISDMFEAAEEEILLMSHDLNTKFYQDERLISSLKSAAERGVVIWIMIRQPKDWSLLTNHPLSKILEHFYENGIFIRFFRPDSARAAALKADFMVIDCQFFRWEPNYNGFHATAALIPAAARALRDYFRRLWIDETNNLSGNASGQLTFSLHTEGESEFFVCDDFPGITSDTLPNNLGETQYSLERVTNLAMGCYYSREDMSYTATVSSDKATLSLKSSGSVRYSPEVK